jgi:threonyl-tRNA synthetase
MKNDHYLNNLRHSVSHLMASAVMELYPDAKPTLGPATDDGFYYDFDFKDPISEADLPKIEQKMHEIAKNWKEFKRIEVSAKEAKKEWNNNQYKKELIEELEKNGEQITFYQSGNFTDLCKGGHTDHPDKELKHFKLLSIAGAYWRGNEKNKMLTRIYGTAFATKEELEKFLWQKEEAKKRDHRKLGKELELFTIRDEVGPGLIIRLPKGNVIREELIQWAHQTEKERGYQHVATPHITKENLYFTSGHLPYYEKDMFPPMILDNNEKYYLKPMNCPHHHMVYDARPRSYRELPLRLAEYGMCYRYEASGELFGLMRVRSLEINDSHIYCTEEQAVEEFVNVMKLHEYYYKTLGINEYHLELALRDPNDKKKYHGNEQMWEKAEHLMREACKQVDIPMVEEEGSAAFYGPKIDFIIHSSVGREFAISTNQIDLYMGEQFHLSYTDQKGNEQIPVIIHRAPLGSSERFIGFLIEHYAGAFPVWLSPVQVKLIPISERHVEYARSVVVELARQNIRVELDDRSERMQAKIREATLQKIPYIGILGDKEMQQSTQSITIRTREGKDLGLLSLNAFSDLLKKDIEKKI